MLKHNKYVCILSIAVTTLLYITISMITIFSMYIMHVHLGSGCNSYQGHVNDSGEFWRVLGCTCIRCHWKCDILDTFTHHFCANRHGWIIGTSFPYIRKIERRHSSPVQYTCISSRLSWWLPSLPELWCVCHQLKLANEPAKLWWQVCGRNHRWCQREGRTWKTSWKSKAWRDFEELLCRGVKGLGNGSKYCHILSGCYDKDLHDWFYLFLCTDTGVIATHALSFYQPLAPLSCWLMCSSLLWLRAAPYCTLLRTVTYCCSDTIVLVTPIVCITLLFSYST